MVGDEEGAGRAWRRWRRRVAVDDELDAGESIGVADEARGDWEVEEDPENGEEETEWEPD